MPTSWNSGTVQQASDRFREQPPQHLLRWTLDTFGEDAVMGTGFGYSGVSLMHMLSEVAPGATVFFLDTDLLFAETYRLQETLDKRLDLNITRVPSSLSLDEQEAEHGPALWERDPDQCCFLRKVKPLRRYLADKRSWITAIRRDQSSARVGTDLVEWNTTHDVVKVNPLAYWTTDDVWRYIHTRDLPYNPLHDAGYPSIGCIPCTAPVSEEDDERAGRWAGSSKTECGLHAQEEPQAA